MYLAEIGRTQEAAGLRSLAGTLRYKAARLVSPSARLACGHLRSIDRLFRQARPEAGLPKYLVLYCARHDYGTRVLMRTGNLAAVMRTVGHRDVKTAMHYQHPGLEIVRAALDYNAEARGAEIRVQRKRLPHLLRYAECGISDTPQKLQPRQVVENLGECAAGLSFNRLICRKSLKAVRES